MKLAVPCDTPLGLMGQRSGHFGHCAFFAVCTIEDGEIKNVETVQNVDHDAVGCGGVIDFAPYTRFTNGGMKVYIDQTEPLVGKAVAKFIAGEVPEMRLDQACRH